MKKRILSFLLALILLAALTGCEQNQQMDTHKIGVVVYDLHDAQVQAFREYLEDYIAHSFPDVEFLYSDAITDSEGEMEFLRSAIAAGVQGILAFNSYDLPAEVALCAENRVYYIRPSSTVADDQFRLVADNPYFLGYFGPGEEMVYQAGYDMGLYFADKGLSDSYYILTGGAASGNTMHYQRTVGILDALQAGYGVTLPRTSQELAICQGPLTIQEGPLTVTLFSGYVGIPQVGQLAVTAYEQSQAGVVLGVIPLQAIADSMPNAKLGIIDCYTAANGELFRYGRLCYLTGKYQSIIAPAFAAMYNAIGGYAQDFRDNGKAFAISQGFWTSTSYRDFQEKYALSSGIAVNAYSYEDILDVCKAHNPNADLDRLKLLASQWDFESAVQRRK